MRATDGIVDFESDDVDEIVELFTRAFGAGVRGAHDDGRRCHLRMRSRAVAGLRLTRWSMHGVATGHLDTRDDLAIGVLAGVRLAGEMSLVGDSDDVDTARPYLCPDDVSTSTVDAEVLNIAVARDTVAAAASAAVGVEHFEPQFTGTAALDRERARLWQDTMIYASRILLLPRQQLNRGLLEAEIQQLVVTALLETFPNSTLDQTFRGSSRPSATIRRALQYIEENLAAPIGPMDIAGAAHVSLRGLHAAFRRELDESPMAYVKRARLAAARTELSKSDIDVTDLAVRWGFSSTKQFDHLYRRVYGVPPEAHRAG